MTVCLYFCERNLFRDRCVYGVFLNASAHQVAAREWRSEGLQVILRVPANVMLNWAVNLLWELESNSMASLENVSLLLQSFYSSLPHAPTPTLQGLADIFFCVLISV